MKTHFQTFIRAYSSVDEREREFGGDYILCPPDSDFGYHSTPKNSLTFARMGVDGVHWSILTIEVKVRDDSPIVYVSPMDSDDVAVMGESLLSFFAVNCHVSLKKMEAIFEAVRSGDQKLVTFLAKKFQRDELLQEERINQLYTRFIHMIERRFVDD